MARDEADHLGYTFAMPNRSMDHVRTLRKRLMAPPGAPPSGASLPVAASGAPVLIVPAQTAKTDGAQTQLNDAAAALQKGLIDQAIQFYTDAIADKGLSNDRRAVAMTDRGAAHMRRQAYKLAIDDFNRAVQLSPEYAPAYNNRGNALIAIGALREAIKDFDRALVLSPSFGAAFANRASAHFRLGALDPALADYSRAIELTPQSVSALNGRGLVHLTADRPHAAARDFSRALTLDVRFAAGYRNRAAALTVLARPDDAIEDLSRAITFDGRSLENHLLRGDAYLAAGNTASALKDFNRALELSPRSAPAFASRALAHLKADAGDDALNDLAKAIELDPKYARAYAIRVLVYRQLNQLDLAQKDMERGLKFEPVTADALWAQGELEDARGRNEVAIQAFTKALVVDPRHRLTLESLNRLGLVATRDEAEIAGGVDGWRVYQAGDQFTARHPQYAALKVPLEMLAKGTPRLVAFERQKSPYAAFAVLRFAAGRLEVAGQTAEDLEAAVILDLQAQAILGLTLNKRGAKTATWTWDDGRVAVASADGMTEEFSLKGGKGGAAMAAAATEKAAARREGGGASSQNAPRPASASGGSGGPAWSPWSQNPASSGSGGGGQQKQAARPQQKPKTLFEMLFGN
jgi:tetratricopeptide (TPR) repeat protein